MSQQIIIRHTGGGVYCLVVQKTNLNSNFKTSLARELSGWRRDLGGHDLGGIDLSGADLKLCRHVALQSYRSKSHRYQSTDLQISTNQTWKEYN